MEILYLAALNDEVKNLNKFFLTGVGKINASLIGDQTIENLSLNEAIKLINERKVKMGQKITKKKVSKKKISKKKEITKPTKNTNY